MINLIVCILIIEGCRQAPECHELLADVYKFKLIELQRHGINLGFERLSVEESVGQVFCGGVTCGFQIDPQAKPVLRKVIADPSLLPYHAAAIVVIALEGNEDDLKYLLDYVHSYKAKRIGGYELRAFRRVFLTLAHMAVRDVEGAELALRRMCQREYWSDLDLASDYQAVGEMHDGLIISAVEALALTHPDDLQQVVQEAVRETPQSERRAGMRRSLTDRRLKEFAKEYRMKIFLFVPKSARRHAMSNFNGDMERPGPKHKLR